MRGHARTDDAVNDEEFLASVGPSISDSAIFAAHQVLNGHITLTKACAYFGARLKVVEAFMGRLRSACLKDGKVRSTGESVDPWAEPAIFDRKDQELCAAFAVYRTLEKRDDAPLLVWNGEQAH